MKTTKVEASLSNAYKILHPMHTVLVTCCSKSGKANIITLAWAMPTSINPPLVAISVKPNRYSHRIIKETRVHSEHSNNGNRERNALLRQTKRKDCDKFKETKLTPAPAKAVKAPIIMECIAHLECKLRRTFATGDHNVFVGEVVAAYANEGIFREEFDIRRAKLVYHLGGNKFATLSNRVVEPSP